MVQQIKYRNKQVMICNSSNQQGGIYISATVSKLMYLLNAFHPLIHIFFLFRSLLTPFLLYTVKRSIRINIVSRSVWWLQGNCSRRVVQSCAVITMAGRVGFSVLSNDVDLDERVGKKKNEKPRPKIEETSKRSSGSKTPNKKKKASSSTVVEPGVRILKTAVLLLA